MKLNLHVSSFSGWPDGPAGISPTLTAVARAADETGFSTVTVMDHYFQMETLGGPVEPMLEAYTTLGFLAGQTSRVQLGALVTGVTYRHPGLLAKIVTTLDVLSGGRAVLGLGAAWYEREHVGLGVPYPPLAERFERLEEALQVCLQMWGEDEGRYDGRHFTLAETVNRPAPVSRPRPRLLVGGSGERKTLRLVARYADACNLFPTGVEEVRHKLAVLDAHCADVGRDPAEVARTLFAGTDPLADPDGFVEEARTWAGLGVSELWTGAPAGTDDPAGWVRAVGEQTLPRLAGL